VKAQIDLRPINDLANGAQLELRLPVSVTLHGQTHSYDTLLLATRLDARRFQVVTLEPLVLRAEDFGLLPGWKACASLPAEVHQPVGAGECGADLHRALTWRGRSSGGMATSSNC
jgi:hypothetical protein